jgi:hypothetical protein
MPKLVEQLKKPVKSKVKAAPPEPPKVRKVVYPELKGKVGWLTAENARTFLGWKQSPDPSKPYNEFLFKDRNEVPTKCHNVEMQRPFYSSVALQWMGEILGGHWNGDGGEANGEAIVIGRTGLTLDGKHRLIGLALAEQEWLKNPDKYPYWQEEPKIHVFINLGVREDLRSVNTLNTGKPRSLADAIFASGLFGELDSSKSKDKRAIKALSRMADYAVRLLWFRTGANEDAFAPKRTHAESLDFIQRHPKILECVKHIYEENGKEDKLKAYPSPGYAAALLYLMASAKTLRENEEGTGYTQVSCPTEDLLDWSTWNLACEFWTKLAANDKGFASLSETVAEFLDIEGGSFKDERIALIVKAWWRFAEGRKITPETIALETVVDGEGVQRLAECPLVGEVYGDISGIDIGQPIKESK